MKLIFIHPTEDETIIECTIGNNLKWEIGAMLDDEDFDLTDENDWAINFWWDEQEGFCLELQHASPVDSPKIWLSRSTDTKNYIVDQPCNLHYLPPQNPNNICKLYDPERDLRLAFYPNVIEVKTK